MAANLAYDQYANGSSEQISNAHGTVSRAMAYDAADTRVETNARGVATTFRHDNMGRLVEVSDALGTLTLNSHDAHGNRITETDGRGNTTTHSYDGGDRRTATNGPEGVAIQFQYDGADNLVRQTRSGRVTEFEYHHPRYFQTLVRRIHPDGERQQRGHPLLRRLRG